MRSERVALDKLYKRRDRYEIPDWQRGDVWSTSQQRKLIDSILRKWKLPKFYFLKTAESPDTFEVVDGQQRLAAIWGFFDGDLELEGAETGYGGNTYAGLSDAHSDDFDDFEIEYDVITDADDEDVKEFFQRLQAGLPLTSSEKLNSVHSKMRDFAAKVAKHPFFHESTTLTNRRHAYFDICAKVLAVEVEGVDTGLRFEDVKDVFTTNASFSGNSAVAKRVKATLDFLHAAFPVKSTALKQRSMVQSVINLVAHLKVAGMSNDQAPVIHDFVEAFSSELVKQVELGQAATDADYLAFQRTVNANLKSGARQRHDILLRKLFATRPDFFSALSKSKAFDAVLAAEIAKSTGQIQNLIKIINDTYSAQHGDDLFKATNKTVKALVTAGKPITSFDEYKTLIDDLYFVFRESVGQRLQAFPASFVHVNDLRTYLDHDVDHGKGSSAKRKKLAATFAVYAGESNPATLAPERFALVQANLFGALVSDLHALIKTTSASATPSSAGKSP